MTTAPRMPNAAFYEKAMEAKLADQLAGLEPCEWQGASVLGDPWARTIGYGPWRLLKSGPRKGQKKWGKVAVRAIVTTADALAAEAAWLAAGGSCTNCLDEGKVFIGWNHKTGVKYKPCRCQPADPAELAETIKDALKRGWTYKQIADLAGKGLGGFDVSLVKLWEAGWTHAVVGALYALIEDLKKAPPQTETAPDAPASPPTT